MAYIGNFPTAPGFNAVNFKMNTQTKKTRAASGRVIRATNSTILWSGTLSFPPMTQAEFRPIQAFVAQAEGPLNEFDIVIPTVSNSQALDIGNGTNIAEIISGTVFVEGAHSAGDTSINVTTFPDSTGTATGDQVLLKAGDIVRFANHTKVYMATTDVNTDSAGLAVLNIKPALITALVDEEAVTTNNVPFRMIMSTDTQEFSYRTDNLIAYEIDIEETI
tara:strand:+ start:132 stop:791 length:660 start_codon:yes stop_codon:yes gene_type:complete